MECRAKSLLYGRGTLQRQRRRQQRSNADGKFQPERGRWLFQQPAECSSPPCRVPRHGEWQPERHRYERLIGAEQSSRPEQQPHDQPVRPPIATTDKPVPVPAGHEPPDALAKQLPTVPTHEQHQRGKPDRRIDAAVHAKGRKPAYPPATAVAAEPTAESVVGLERAIVGFWRPERCWAFHVWCCG